MDTVISREKILVSADEILIVLHMGVYYTVDAFLHDLPRNAKHRQWSVVVPIRLVILFEGGFDPSDLPRGRNDE